MNTIISKEELLDLKREWGYILSFNLPDEYEQDYYQIYVVPFDISGFDILVGPSIFSTKTDIENNYVLYIKEDVRMRILRQEKISTILNEL